MKGVICYFSGSGNTRLACQYIAKNCSRIEFRLFDIVKDTGLDIDSYDIIGFATWADYLGPSKRMRGFIEGLPAASHKPAFVFNTYGNFNGGTLRALNRLVKSKGFEILAGHALHMPENIPNMIMNGLANTQAPNEKELYQFNQFIANLNSIVDDLKNKQNIRLKPFKLGFPDSIMPVLPRGLGRKVMGIKQVDISLCTRCGICAGLCPYKAIEMKELPVFDQKKCYGCWICYNHCPSLAIYTKKYRGVGHYKEPISQLKEKLK